MNEALTDRKFWEDYWRSKPDLDVHIPADYTFSAQLSAIVHDQKPTTAIELGGFPGYYAVFLRKYLAVKSTLFDYFIERGIISSLLKKNNLNDDVIEVIEGDLFSYVPEQRYDLVLSCGLIEHFDNTEEIIKSHLAFLKPGGTLFITLPNFKAVNGWVQKRFDLHNFSKHNLASMDVEKLAAIAKKLGLAHVRCGYFGRFSVWLENKQEKKGWVKTLVKSIWILGKIATRVVPVESKSLSPYIILQGKLPDWAN
ncbi:MAG: methyltransferase domain-containing protein [Mucilaginibacter polytrichastri]|nr:methyltransferase domain-containing protein [Mucilaginibacter polytrichastri]